MVWLGEVAGAFGSFPLPGCSWVVLLAGGIGSDVRGIALPVGVSVLLTTTGAGAFPHAAKRAHATTMTSKHCARPKKADCILTNSKFLMNCQCILTGKRPERERMKAEG